MSLASLFAACQATDSIPVMDVHGAACDNAAASLGSEWVPGRFDDAFLAHWYGSLQDILACGDVSAESRAFFDALGVNY